MDPSLYPRMAAVEDAHWWFAARRAICERLIDRLALPAAAQILEPGCGTGGNFPMLARRGKLFAIDADVSALSFAASRRLATLARGTLPDDIPFGDTRFDLALMTDVLEHLDDPAGALRAVRARLTPGGWLLLTVPALPQLWSEHDLTHHHRRRYRATELRQMLTGAGFNVSYLSHCNFILLPAIAAARLLGKVIAGRAGAADGRHDLAMPPAILNHVLFHLYAVERFVVGRLRVPLGVSLIALARA
ncbi:MAG TPA: class I SAM-dependent methyltransferase [Candidatus Binataceae bacterium]|nr:class I SAM-dependent methyltransferase [Candidatus Binataceae bacterium]